MQLVPVLVSAVCGMCAVRGGGGVENGTEDTFPLFAVTKWTQSCVVLYKNSERSVSNTVYLNEGAIVFGHKVAIIARTVRSVMRQINSMLHSHTQSRQSIYVSVQRREKSEVAEGLSRGQWRSAAYHVNQVVLVRCRPWLMPWLDLDVDIDPRVGLGSSQPRQLQDHQQLIPASCHLSNAQLCS